MDDDKINPEENQSPPAENQGETHLIFETTPVEPEQPVPQEIPGQAAPEPPPENLQPEEIAPELASAEEASTAPAAPFEIPTDQPPPMHHSSKRNTLFIIGGGAVLFIVLFVLIISFVLGRGKGGSTEQITLNYWGIWEDKEILDPLIKQFEAKNKNIKINYQKMAPQDYREKLLARSKNGQGPDIFRFHNTWIPEIKEVVSALPSTVMKGEEFDKTFYPIHKSDLKVGDSYYGMPLYIDGLVLVYNENLFKKAGINSAPVTWDDVVDYAGKIAVHGAGGELVTAGIALGTASNVEHFSDIFGLFLVLNGLTIKNLDDSQAAVVLEAYRKFAEKLVDGEEKPINVWDENMPNSIAAFIQEKVAMIIVPSWEIITIKSANPELALKVAPIPIIPGAENSSKSIATYWVEGVSRYSKNQLEAWQFLKFLSEKETMTKLYENQSKSRLFGAPYSRVDLGALLSDNEYTGVIIKQANSYVSQPTISRTYDNGLNDEIAKYIEKAISATAEGVSYGEALGTAKTGIDEVLKKFQIQ